MRLTHKHTHICVFVWFCVTYEHLMFVLLPTKLYQAIYINNCPTRCNTKQSIYYSASSLYMFRVSTTPIIMSTQNCTTASSTVQLTLSNVARLAWPRWWEVAAQKLWPVPEAVVTVLCTPDDECGWHPKHVEWTCRIINRLLCVASRWTIITIDQRCTEP